MTYRLFRLFFLQFLLYSLMIISLQGLYSFLTLFLLLSYAYFITSFLTSIFYAPTFSFLFLIFSGFPFSSFLSFSHITFIRRSFQENRTPSSAARGRRAMASRRPESAATFVRPRLYYLTFMNNIKFLHVSPQS